MIKAHEAHDLTTDRLNQNIFDELENIETKINDAILNCKYQCVIDKLSKEAEKFLKESGYKITNHDNYFKDKNEYIISWERCYK